MLIEYNLLNGNINGNFKDNTVFESSRAVVICFGRLYHNIDTLDADRLFFSPSDYISNPFILINYSKTDKLLTIKQDFFGGNSNLFFCCKDNILFISQSLQELKSASNIPYMLNISCLPSFICNGFIAGEPTLIQNVFKLAPGCEIFISTDSIKINQTKYCSFYNNIANPAKNYDFLMRNAIYRSTEHLDSSRYNIALSGGYDSNCILHYIRELHPKSAISAFSVGGTRGVDETKTARRICQIYGNSDFSAALVNPHTLDNMDEITYLLEGSVYERGIFLQYELGRLLKDKGCRSLICGECADQVFHSKLFDFAPDNTFNFGYWDNPYEMACCVVLKKSVLTMNYFNITPAYPFLDSNVVKFAYSIRNENGRTKEFHKRMCSEIISPKVLPLISKQGGTTSMAALFDESFDAIGSAKKMKYYDNNFKLTEKYPHDEAAYDYYLTLLYLESFEKQFCDKN